MFLERIRLRNLLSFGPQTEELELRPLNVLIGANGSGKSNFVEAIGLLQAAPVDLDRRVRVGRGVADWLWQGEPKADAARLDAILRPSGMTSLYYQLEFAERQQRFAVTREYLEPAAGEEDLFYAAFAPEGNGAQAIQMAKHSESKSGTPYRSVEYPMDDGNSMFAQIKDAGHYPELAGAAKELARICFYGEWPFGPNAARSLRKRDLPNANLAEDHANLGLVLNRLAKDDEVRERIAEALRRLHQDVSDFHVNIECNAAQVFLQERGGQVTVPATRLSSGTARYLSLLAVLCDPQPPPLACIEAPELGLHPDILPGLAKLLLEASERCQLVVTTHSEILVDALTHEPESVVICEKEEGQTKLRRPSRSELRHWVEKYRLGELWSSGEIGGNRW